MSSVAPTVAPTVPVKTAKVLDRNRPQRRQKQASPRKPGVPTTSVLRKQRSEPASSKDGRRVKFESLPGDGSRYDGQPKAVGVQNPTRRSVADRAELISRDLPFQKPVLVGLDKTRFVTQPADVHTKDGQGGPISISTSEYNDHALNMRLLNYLPRDKALMQLSAVTVKCLETIGRADKVHHGKGYSKQDRIAAVVTTYIELRKLSQAISDYLDAQVGTLDKDAEEEADRFDAVVEKLGMIDDNIEITWNAIKSQEAAVRNAGFKL